MHKLKHSYSFLYLPEDQARTRELRVPRWALLLSGGALSLVAALAIAYLFGLTQGASWMPGGSQLVQENQHLRTEVRLLEGQVNYLRADLQEVFEMQRLVAQAVDLEPMDPETFEAGVGGRAPLRLHNQEIPDLAAGRPGEQAELQQELDKLLRQAKIQRQGFQAILDTLTMRSVARNQIPSIRPCDTGWLSSRFGIRKDPFTGRQAFHRGIDFSVPVGSPVRVAGDGVVVAVQQQRGLGKVIKVEHGGDVVTVYAHLNKALVKKGQKVTRGDLIAESGNSGRSTAPHLHYEIRIGGRAVNPITYILDSYSSRN